MNNLLPKSCIYWVIDKIIQELDNQFDEINMELLSCMTALNPSNTFASFRAQKVCRLAKFYPKGTYLVPIYSSLKSNLITILMSQDNMKNSMASKLLLTSQIS
jgi:hypothetical protein